MIPLRDDQIGFLLRMAYEAAVRGDEFSNALDAARRWMLSRPEYIDERRMAEKRVRYREYGNLDNLDLKPGQIFRMENPDELNPASPWTQQYDESPNPEPKEKEEKSEILLDIPRVVMVELNSVEET